jgi:hypothetical protein
MENIRCYGPHFMNTDLQYKEFGLKAVLVRDLTLCLSKDNYEWWLEFEVSETERVI